MNKNIEIIYQDDDILVVNKPSGISVTKDRSGKLDLIPILQSQEGLDREIRLIHRLDKDTSGVMVLALTPEAQSVYASCFEKRLVKKTYLALVSGMLFKERGIIRTAISQDRKTRLMRLNPRKGKATITEYALLADFGLISLVGVKPITGRTHQIRVHLSSINAPLAIDPLYGSKKPVFLSDFKAGYRVAKGREEERALIERLTLHAYQLELPEIDDRGAKTLVAGLDKKFTATLKMLSKHNERGFEAFLEPENYNHIIKAEPLNL